MEYRKFKLNQQKKKKNNASLQNDDTHLVYNMENFG